MKIAFLQKTNNEIAMLANIIIDPTSPFYVGASSNAYSAGQTLARIVCSGIEKNHSSNSRDQLSKGISPEYRDLMRPEYVEFTRKAYGTWKDYRKTVHLLKLIQDFGLTGGFYKKNIGKGAKIILKGYVGKREHFNWVIRNFAKGSDMLKFGQKALAKSARTSLGVEAFFEIIEFAVDYHQADPNKAWGVKDFLPHFRDVAAVGVGGAAVVIAGGAVAVAGSVVTVPVIVAFVVPVAVGALAKSGYKWFFNKQMSREDIYETEDGWTSDPKESKLTFPATFDRPLLSMGPELKVSNNEVIFDLNAWMELKGFFSPLPTTDRIDFAKQINLP